MARDKEKKAKDETPLVLPSMLPRREPRPPGPMKPMVESTPPPIPSVPHAFAVLSDKPARDDAVTKRVWIKTAFAEAAKQSAVENKRQRGGAPKPPTAVKQTIYPPPAPGALRPPATISRAFLDEDAVTQEIKIDRLIALTRGNEKGWQHHLSRGGKDSSIPPSGQTRSSYPPPVGTALVSERPTDLSGLALASIRAKENDKKRRASIIPAIQLSIKSIIARLLKTEPDLLGHNPPVAAKRSVFSLFRSTDEEDSPYLSEEGIEILKGISPRLLRAAAFDKTENNYEEISNEDWRNRVESSSTGDVQSFLAPRVEAGARTATYPFAQPAIGTPPKILQGAYQGAAYGPNASTGRSAYRISMGGLGPDGEGSRPSIPPAGDTSVSMQIVEPPRIRLKGALIKRGDREILMLRGRAEHPIRVRDIMVFADKQKILYLSSASREDAAFIEFSADVPLYSHTDHILVVARHDDDVMGSQSLFVRRDKSHQINLRAVAPLRIVK